MIVVTGHRRTGTSLMMRALHAGLKAGVVMYSEGMERVNPERGGYKPNPGGLYEVGAQHYLDPQFLRQMPADGVVKILSDGLPNLPKGQYTLIWMERDPNEINASIERVEKHLKDHAESLGCVLNDHKETTQLLPFCCMRPYNQVDQDHIRGICEARSDMDIVRIRFKDVIEDPVKAFKTIKFTPLGKIRVDLDVQKAVSIVDSKLYRERASDNDRHRYQGTSTNRIDSAIQA